MGVGSVASVVAGSVLDFDFSRFWNWHAVAILRSNTSWYERIIRILINARLITIGRFVRVAYARSRPFVLWAQ